MGFYVVSDDKCFYEGMTKEQILTAITQAIETHQIANVDTGFVTTLKEANQNKPMSFWVGTTAEYNAIEEKLDDCIYLLTDDTELEDLEALIRRSMNVLKGEVILDASSDPVPYSEYMPVLNIPLTGEHPIIDFTFVQVIDEENDIIMCAVKPYTSQGVLTGGAGITGMSNVSRYVNDPTNPTLCYKHIDININHSEGSGDVLSMNRSTFFPVNDPQSEYTARGIKIKKIIGVM